jgi:hypothetical protein
VTLVLIDEQSTVSAESMSSEYYAWWLYYLIIYLKWMMLKNTKLLRRNTQSF